MLNCKRNVIKYQTALYSNYNNKYRKVIFSFICMFCWSLFVLLYFFFWPLCCLFFFDIRILIAPLVSSNYSFKQININKCRWKQSFFHIPLTIHHRLRRNVERKSVSYMSSNCLLWVVAFIWHSDNLWIFLRFGQVFMFFILYF